MGAEWGLAVGVPVRGDFSLIKFTLQEWMPLPRHHGPTQEQVGGWVGGWVLPLSPASLKKTLGVTGNLKANKPPK